MDGTFEVGLSLEEGYRFTEVSGMRARPRARQGRDPRGRLRIDSIQVTLEPEGEDTGRIGRCLELFEDFCIVTQSVRSGFQVDVRVEPRATLSAAGTQADAV